MNSQQHFPLTVDQDLSRWPRLAFGLAYIEANGPVLSPVLGRAWNTARGIRGAKSMGAFDRSVGSDIGKALRKRGLVRYKQCVGWYRCDERGKPLRKADSGDVDWGGFGDAA